MSMPKKKPTKRKKSVSLEEHVQKLNKEVSALGEEVSLYRQSSENTSGLVAEVRELREEIKLHRPGPKRSWYQKLTVPFFFSVVVTIFGIWYNLAEDNRAEMRRTHETYQQKRGDLRELASKLPDASVNLELMLTKAYALESELRNIPEGVSDDVPFVQYVALAKGAMKAGHFKSSEHFYNRALAILESDTTIENRDHERFQVYSTKIDLYNRWMTYEKQMTDLNGPIPQLVGHFEKGRKAYKNALRIFEARKVQTFFPFTPGDEIGRKYHEFLLNSLPVLHSPEYLDELESISALGKQLFEHENDIISLYKELASIPSPKDFPKPEERPPNIPSNYGEANRNLMRFLENEYPYLYLKKNYGRMSESDKQGNRPEPDKK